MPVSKPRELRSDSYDVRTMICRDFVQVDFWGNSMACLSASQAERLGRWLLRYAEWARKSKRKR